MRSRSAKRFAVTDRTGNRTTVPWAVCADHISPAAILTVPASLITITIPIEWSAIETRSGLRGYDLQVGAHGGQTWTGTLDTDATYTTEMGRSYTFRVRATGQVSNTGDWAVATARTMGVKKYYSVAGQRMDESFGFCTTSTGMWALISSLAKQCQSWVSTAGTYGPYSGRIPWRLALIRFLSSTDRCAQPHGVQQRVRFPKMRRPHPP